jgi:hypothetical protein
VTGTNSWQVKRLSGMTAISNNTDLSSLLQLENTEHLSAFELAHLINDSFLETSY